MKKSDFITLVVGVVGGLLFSLGMCMCLLPEWNSFNSGVVVTAIGAVILLALLAKTMKSKFKDGKKVNWKTIGKVAFGILSCLVFGLGMCFIMVWKMILIGIIIGIIGIVLLLCLIPMCVGFK